MFLNIGRAQKLPEIAPKTELFGILKSDSQDNKFRSFLLVLRKERER